MKYTMTAKNERDSYTRQTKTNTAMLEARERINFMLDSISTPDELLGIEMGIEELFEDYGYSFRFENERDHEVNA